jgi:hypothetical protein
MSRVRAISTLSIVLFVTACATPQPGGTSADASRSAVEKRVEEALRGNKEPFNYAMRGPDESVVDATRL